MAHISSYDFSIRARISQEIQAAIDTAAEQNASLDFTAGLETALAIVTHAIDAKE